MGTVGIKGLEPLCGFLRVGPQPTAYTNSAISRKYIAKEGLEPSRPFTREHQRAALPFAYFASQGGEIRTLTPLRNPILSRMRLPVPPHLVIFSYF